LIWRENGWIMAQIVKQVEDGKSANYLPKSQFRLDIEGSRRVLSVDRVEPERSLPSALVASFSLVTESHENGIGR